MARHISSIRGAKAYRARLCLAGPRVRAQVSVHALESGLVRAEPETHSEVSISDSPSAPSSPPSAPSAGGAAQTAGDDGAVSAAPAAPDASAASQGSEDVSEEAQPVPGGSPAEPAVSNAFDVVNSDDQGSKHTSTPSNADSDRVEVAAEDFMYQVGDVVTGRVVYANAKGARVKLNGCPDILGCADLQCLAVTCKTS